MVYCTLDGKVGYPTTTDKIKVTYENQYVKDSGSYTYDITFPMAIAENRTLFANVQRFDVKKTIAAFEECRLYVGNRLVMSGKGTVTSITNDKVKLQIAGGKSRIKYNSKFEQHFIDEIDYSDVVLTEGVDAKTMAAFGFKTPVMASEVATHGMLFVSLDSSNYVGRSGVAVLSPTWDETNDVQANRVVSLKDTTLNVNGHKHKGEFRLMVNPALQPYLFFILREVLSYEGYKLKTNELDKEPWNRLVIVSATKTGKIKDALPHWTVYKFLDEVRKFFNASIVFDEVAKTVNIYAANELLSQETVEYEAEDEFSSEYDEDGLQNMATSNIAYAFDDAANRDWRECIPLAVLEKYTVKEYASGPEFDAAVSGMTDREKRSNIFKVGYNYYIWAELPEDGNPENETLTWQRTQCGVFNPIVRDATSEDSEDLNICPAAMHQRRNYEKKDELIFLIDDMGKNYIVVPSVSNERESSFEDMEQDEDGEYYTTAQDAIQNGGDDTDETDSDDTKMPVAFQANCVVNRGLHKPVEASDRLDGEDTSLRAPVLYTDHRMFPTYITSNEKGSLSLEYNPVASGNTFGNLNGTASENRFGGVAVDKNNLITVKFVTDDIPDPSKIYIFRNKRYICSKIEMNVTNDGIDREKTGYFYELL